MILFLIGFKSCGKSVIGKQMATRMGASFVDLDTVIEQWHERQTGERCSFRQIYRQYGEPGFRQLERTALHELETQGQTIISVGGGTLMDGQNIRILKQSGKVVYIVVEPEALYQRIMSAGIPAIFDDRDPRGSFDELYADRNPIYETMADYRVDTTGLDIEQSAEKICNVIAGLRPGDCG